VSWRAAVLTVSDRASAGTMTDESGPAVQRILAGAGFDVFARLRVTSGPEHERPRHDRSCRQRLVRSRVLRELPMRAEGLRKTPMAALSRSVAGVRGRTLVLNLPGSVKGATESLEAVVPVLRHAVAQLAGQTSH